MNRIIGRIIGSVLSLCLIALIYFTVNIHDMLESRHDIEIGYVEALRVVMSRNYDSKEELLLKNQLLQEKARHVHIYYSPEQQSLIPYTSEILDKAHTENRRLIGEYPAPPLDLILFQDSEQFYDYSQIRNTNGYYSDFDKVIGILPIDMRTNSPANTQKELINYIIMHEYSHYALLQKIQTLGVQEYIPEWFLEGYAEYISFQPAEAGAHRNPLDHLIPFENLEKSQQWKHLRTAGAVDIYRQSEEAIAYIINEYGKDFIIDILKQTRQSESFEEAIQQATGLDYDELEARLLAPAQ
ncbi:hypothetical protein [Pradoshia sp.]